MVARSTIIVVGICLILTGCSRGCSKENGPDKSESRAKYRVGIKDNQETAQLKGSPSSPEKETSFQIGSRSRRRDGQPISVLRQESPQHQSDKEVQSKPGRPQTNADLEEKGGAQDDRLSTVAPDDSSHLIPVQPTASESAEEASQETPPRNTEDEVPSESELEEDEPEYSDAEPPELRSIWFEPEKVPPGANVFAYVHAIDNLSGVNSVFGTVESPSGTATLSFGCRESVGAGAFVGRLEIPEHAEMGFWYVRSLNLTDNVHNTTTYSQNSPEFGSAHFEIVESDSDNVPPEVTGVYVDPPEVNEGETVRVMVEVYDNKSGVANVYGDFISPSRNARLAFSCQYSHKSDMFQGNVSVPEDAESGEWLLNYLRAIDEAKNLKTFSRTDYPDIIGGVSFRVYTSGSDAQPPTLDNLTIYPSMVAYEETVSIIVEASDDVSGVSHISGRFRGPSGTAHIPFSCAYDQNTQEYIAKVVIKTNTEVGWWHVEYIRMVDNAHNTNYVTQTNQLVEEAVFEITGE